MLKNVCGVSKTTSETTETVEVNSVPLESQAPPQPSLPILATELSEEPMDSGFNYFFAIRPDHLYRLVVDGYRHQKERGFYHYEQREKGSVRRVLEAILLGLPYIKEHSALTKEFLIAIHKTCSPEYKGEFMGAEPGSQFGFIMAWLTVDGVKEAEAFAQLLEKETNKQASAYLSNGSFTLQTFSFNYLKNSGISKDGPPMHVVNHSVESCNQFFDYIVADYNVKRKDAISDEAFIKAAIDVAYNVEHLHGFEDANLRTSIVILNILLMSGGFPPVTFYDPNQFDGLSKNELFSKVKKGMLKTLDIIQRPDEAHFKFNNSSFTDVQKREIKEMVDPVIKAQETFSIKKLEEAEIKAMTKRIKALPSYPKPEYIYINGKRPEDISPLLRKYGSVEDKKFMKKEEVTKLLEDIRKIEKDQKGESVLTLKEVKGITRVIFNTAEEAKKFAKDCKECEADSQARGEKLWVAHGDKFAVYLSEEDVEKLEQKYDYNPLITLLPRVSTTIELVNESAQRSYLITLKDKAAAQHFINTFELGKSYSRPGSSKRIILKEVPPKKGWRGLLFSSKPQAMVYLSADDLLAIRGGVCAKEERAKGVTKISL